MLSLISSLQDITLKEISIIKQRNTESFQLQNNQKNISFEANDYSPDAIIEWNNLFCDYFRDEILSSFEDDYHLELRQVLSEKFLTIKEDSNINFVRWLNRNIKLISIDNANDEPKKSDFFDNLDQKKWSKLLKNISNQVAHVMKASSYFLNYTNHIINLFGQENANLGVMKKRGMTFSNDLFMRHKK